MLAQRCNPGEEISILRLHPTAMYAKQVQPGNLNAETLVLFARPTSQTCAAWKRMDESKRVDCCA